MRYEIPIEIPPFDDMLISKSEMIEVKNLFEEMAKIIKDRCGMFQIHIAYYAVDKLKENLVESMKLNMAMLEEEKKRREENPNGNNKAS